MHIYRLFISTSFVTSDIGVRGAACQPILSKLVCYILKTLVIIQPMFNEINEMIMLKNTIGKSTLFQQYQKSAHAKDIYNPGLDFCCDVRPTAVLKPELPWLCSPGSKQPQSHHRAACTIRVAAKGTPSVFPLRTNQVVPSHLPLQLQYVRSHLAKGIPNNMTSRELVATTLKVTDIPTYCHK